MFFWYFGQGMRSNIYSSCFSYNWSANLLVFIKTMLAHNKYLFFDLINILVVAALYTTNNLIFKKMFWGTPVGAFCVGYFNDLICPFGFLSYLNICFSFAKYRITRFWEMQLWILAAGLAWEFVAPLLKPTSVTDPLDLLCYHLGAVGYYCINKLYIINISMKKGK